MKVLIVEDEPLAVERLRLLLAQYDPLIQITGSLESIASTVKHLEVPERVPDLLLMDIHLSDGSAFEIFKQLNLTTPVIFTTAYDQYAIEAFKVFSIDYLLKPVTLQSLTMAIDKMKKLRSAPRLREQDYKLLAEQSSSGNVRYRTRFMGRVGQKFFFVHVGDIALFMADNKIVQLIATDNTRYLVDYTLEELEAVLDPSLFFRINRSMIVHAAAIEQIKPFVNQRLRLYLRHPVKTDDIFISRDRVPSFKKWADY